MFVQHQTFFLGLKYLWAQSRVDLDQLTHVKAGTCLVCAAGVLLLPSNLLPPTFLTGVGTGLRSV